MRILIFTITFITLLSLALPSPAQDPLSKEDAFVPEDHPEVTAAFEGWDVQVPAKFIRLGSLWFRWREGDGGDH